MKLLLEKLLDILEAILRFRRRRKEYIAVCGNCGKMKLARLLFVSEEMKNPPYYYLSPL